MISPAKEALGEGGNEADLDDESEDRLDGREDRYRIAQVLHWLEEATAVE